MKKKNCKPTAVTALFLMVLAAGPVQSQDASKGASKDQTSADSARMLKIIDAALLARMVDLAGSAKTCNAETTQPCIIEMKTIQYQGRDYCVAVAPDVTVGTKPSGTPKKVIRWKLDADKLTGNGVVKVLAFERNAGLVLTVNQYSQLDLWGKIGDGLGSPLQQIRFHTRTKRDRLGARATYLPVILWGPAGDEELCAAIDPKIVNVQ